MPRARTPRAKVNGYRLAYHTLGSGEPHLLFHWGLLGDQAEFLPLAERLEGVGTRVLIDGRGHGKSDAPAAPYTLEEYADDLAQFIREVVAGPAILVGHEAGGMTFLRLTLRHPHLAAALMLVNTDPAGKNPDTERVYDEVLDTLASEGPNEEVFDVAARSTLLGERFVAEHPDAVASWRKRMTRLDSDAFGANVRAVSNRTDVSDEMAAVAVPALVVVGTNDAVTEPSRTRDLADRLGGEVDRVELPAGHFAPWERPDETADALRGFLEGLGLRPAG